jgi:hypothetical protein
MGQQTPCDFTTKNENRSNKREANATGRRILTDSFSRNALELFREPPQEFDVIVTDLTMSETSE